MLHRAAPLVSVLAACAVALAALPAGSVIIDDGVTSLTVDDTDGAAVDFIMEGIDHLFEIEVYYRTSAMFSEVPIIGHTATPTSVSATGPNEITVLGSTADFLYELVYQLDGTGRLVPTLELTNTTGSLLDVSIFTYHDWDVDDSFDGDSISWDGSQVTQSDGTVIPVTPFQAPDAVEASLYSDIQDRLRDGAVDDLVDGAGLPFGPGDGTFAFQHVLSIAAGGTGQVSYLVPEPTTGALLGLGLLALAWAGRARK